jgi:hypothetical protein
MRKAKHIREESPKTIKMMLMDFVRAGKQNQVGNHFGFDRRTTNQTPTVFDLR